MFSFKDMFCERDSKKSTIMQWLSFILNIFWVIHWSLILFNTCCEIYLIPNESKYKAVFLSINNETQCASLLLFSSRFTKHAPPFILSKLFLGQTASNLDL